MANGMHFHANIKSIEINLKSMKFCDIYPNFYRQKVVNFLDLTLLKDLVYVNIAIGLTMSLYSDGAFFILLPMYLFELGFTKEDAAMISASAAVAELCCRAFMAILSLRFQFKARSMFFIGSISITLIRCGMFV